MKQQFQNELCDKNDHNISIFSMNMTCFLPDKTEFFLKNVPPKKSPCILTLEGNVTWAGGLLNHQKYLSTYRVSFITCKVFRRKWRIRTNQELYQLCGENDIVKFCKLSRLRWAGHVIRQDDNDLSGKVLFSEPGGRRPRGRPKLRWEDGVVEDVARLGCRNWKLVALNREGWRKLLKEAEAHPGL
jgi:hypothetical protein